MSGTKTKDLQLVTQKGATVAFTLEEFTTGNILRAFKGRGGGEADAGRRDGVRPVRQRQQGPVYVRRQGEARLHASGARHGDRRDVRARLLRGGLDVQRHGDRRLCNGRGFGVRKRAGTFVPGEEIAASAIKATLQGIARVADVVLTDKASAPTVRYRQGVDYDLNARTGLLRVRESCSADTVFLTADCESSDEQLVDALTASDVTGELLFVGQPDQGPGLVVQCWKVTLSLSGEVGLISEELASIPMTGEVLADDLNHPESPFFRVRYLG